MKNTALKKNDIVTLEIEDITNLGFGVGKINGAVVFVSSCVPGDVAEVRIIKAASSYYVGRVEKMHRLSDKRSDTRCSLDKCHSCAFRMLRYEDELIYKENVIRSAFLKEGLSDISVFPTVSSPRLTGYRNKAQYPVSKDKSGNYIIGFYAPKSHNVCEAAHCPMAPDAFADILEFLRAFFGKYNISVYDEKSGKGILRHVYLRRAEISGEVLLVLVLNADSLPHSDELVASVTSAFSEICGILINVNREDTNVILGDEYITLFGRDYIVDELAGVRLKITAPSFYQVNRGTADLIYREARRLAGLTKEDTLLDLYCGAGSIGLSMAADAKEVIGIEIVDSAVECAKYNAEQNGITNAEFYTGDAGSAEELLRSAEEKRGSKIKPDVVIFDPPRAGCSPDLIDYVTRLAPRKIVYISCNPTTLARDVRIMREKGYTTDAVKGYDMFPLTGHVESVVCLTRE